MDEPQLAELGFNGGFDLGRQPFDPALYGKYGLGSRNSIIDSDGISRPWKGLNSKGANTGSRVMFPMGSTWGGLKDIGGTQGAGSGFEYVNASRFYIGAGQLSVEGADIAGATASSTLKILLRRAGSYTAVDSGPYSAGLAQPSAPTVAVLDTPGTGFTGFVDGPVSFKLARLRTATGARSIASTTSVVAEPQKKTIRITFPAAAAGQSHWALFATQQGFGGVGLHYRLKYGTSLDIPESVVAAGVVDGISRSLEFDFKDGDLVPELAYIDDYPPPAGTHAAQLGQCVLVGGCYADATSSPTSTSTGTCWAVSLPNFPESYKPSHVLAMPEQLVGVLHRPTDSYMYVGLRNMILAMQYIGLTNGPACALTTVYPDLGIQNPANFCQANGRLYMVAGKGVLVRMNDAGQADYSWASPVRNTFATGRRILLSSVSTRTRWTSS
jgi:hypothetical protein